MPAISGNAALNVCKLAARRLGSPADNVASELSLSVENLERS